MMYIKYSWKPSKKILSHIQLGTAANQTTKIIIIIITQVFPNGNQ